MKKEILKILEKDCRLSNAQISAMLGISEDEVARIIKECEDEGLILGRLTLVDWDRAGEELVTALIEVKVTPQRGDGFDRIAERIYQYEEVESLYLMSGAYDLTVIISGRTLKEVSTFVSSRLATIDGVVSTATHFILKKYKDKNIAFTTQPEQQERMMFC